MRRTLVVTVLAVLLVPSIARSQGAADPYAPQAFHPALGPRNWLTVEGSRAEGRFTWSAGALASYELDPLVVYPARCREPIVEEGRCPGGHYDLGDPISLVEHQMVMHLLGTVTLRNRVHLGLDLPFMYMAGDLVDPETARDIGDVTGFGLADPRLYGKLRILGGGSGLGVAGSLTITLPFADIVGQDPNRRMGGDIPTFVPKVILDWRRSKLALGLNVGVDVRYSSAEIYSSSMGTALLYGIAGSYEFARRYRGIVEVFGSGTPPFDVDVSPMEVDLAVERRLGDFHVLLGGGLGITPAVGSPTVRGFLGGRYEPYRGDRDYDGIDDRRDRCPEEPEDEDGFLDRDGCPDEDNDADGMPDQVDGCPNEAEDVDEFEDTDGCPDEDNDGDGVRDGYDSCPNVAEDMDGDDDTDGCPDEDKDNDGIDDSADQCPDEAEDTDGLADEDGCPEEDADDDGVPDDRDECPEQAEDADRYQDDDGCPERGGRIRG